MQMSYILLHIFHFCYSVFLRGRSFCNYWFSPKPQPLLAPRRRLPNHLAILFATDSSSDTTSRKNALTASILRAVDWCRTIGVKKLTVYEEKDFISQCMHDIISALPSREMRSESDEEYRPPTPPPSDCSDSWPLTPSTYLHHSVPISTIRITDSIPIKVNNQQLRRRNHSKHNGDLHIRSPKSDLLLCIASRASSKPAIASAAQALAQRRGVRMRRGSRSQKTTQPPISIDELNKVLEDEDGLSSPDFMIIHHLDPFRKAAPPELYGFPPWHIRLTEIFHQPQYHGLLDWLRPRSSLSILDETTFRAALDEFACAEMRFGK